MPTIAEVRKQYPQYQDLTDQQLAEGLHRAYYSDMPFDDFAGKIGFEPEPTPEEQSVFRSVADVPVKLGTGVAQGIRLITDAFGADNSVSQNIRGVEGYLQGLLSAQSKQDQAEVARLMKDAEDKGVGAQVVAGLKAFATAPLDTLSQAAGTAVPTIIGGLAGGVLRLVAVRTIGALTGAGTVKSSIYDATKQTLLETGATEEQAERTAQQAQEYGGKNLDLILTGAGLGIFAAGTGLEKAVANKILSRAAAGEAAEEAAQQGLIRRTAVSAAKEAGPEALQAGQEQFAENVALQREGFDVPTFRGVAGAATLEGVAGAVLGGGLGAMGPAREDAAPSTPSADEPAPPPAPPAPPKPIESAQDLLNAPPKVAAESAPEALRNEPLRLTNEQVEEELGQMEQIQEQLATLLFTPAEIEAQAAATNVPVEAFTTDLTNTYDNLATRIDVFHKNYMQRMNEDVTTAPAAPAPAAPAPAAPAPAAPAPNIQVATTPSVATSTTPATPVRASRRITAPAEEAAASETQYPIGYETAIRIGKDENEGTAEVKRSEAISIAEAEAQAAFDYVREYSDLDDAVQSRKDSVRDTLQEYRLGDYESFAFKAFDKKVKNLTAARATAPTTPTTETTSEPVSTRAGEAVAGATAGSPALPVQRGVPAGREAARPEGAGVEPVGGVAERVDEREGVVSPALTQAQRRVSRPTMEQKSAVADRIARRLAARETPRAGKGPFGKNKAVVSPRFNPRVNGFIKSIVNQIGLGNTNIIVLDRNELATPEALTATADRYGLYDGFSVEGLTADAASPNTFGAVMPLPNGQGYALFVDSGTEIRVLLENIGHELGHIVEYEALSNADKNTRNAIFDEYLAWLSENKDETTAKLIRKVRAAATAEADLADLSEDMVLSEKDQEYFKSFAEWFADNVAKWMTTSEKPLSVVEKFFSTLAAKLKRLAAYLTGNRPEFLPSQAVKNFLDGLGTPNDTMASSMIKQAMGFKGPRPIFPSIEGLKNFWGWFSESKVVDEEGRPIVMYHGSPKVFSVFRPGGRAKAIFLSPDPYFADRFTVDEYDYDVGPIYAVYVNAKNPFDYENYQHIAALEAALAEELEKSGGSVRATGDSLNWDELVSAIKDGDWRTIENPVVQKAIKKIGHDGFYVMESLYSPELGDRVESKNLAVYESNQVKSAIGNNGKFSPKANDIRQSRKIARTTLNNIGNAPNKLPKFNNRIYEGVRSVLDSTRITDNMRSALYMFTSLPQQVQMFVKELPTLEGLLNVLNIRASALKDKKEGLDRNVRKWSDAIKKHSKYKDEFYEVAHESTRLQIEFNNQKFANHPLTQRFNRLPADLQKVYWQMLKSYRGMADEYLTLLSKNMSPREAARLQREMAKKRLRVYLPLYREGDYWLRYQDATNEMVVRSFKSNYERELAWKEALANGAKRGSDQMFSRVEDFFEGGGPGTFFNRVLEDLKSRGAPEAVKRSLYELYLDQIPASSVRQLYRKRDGYKGYEADLINVYSNVATRMANQLTNLEYIPEIDKVYDDVKQEAKVYSESGKSKNMSVPLLIKNLDKQIEYLRDPGNSTLVNTLSSFSYYWYIIANTSTAVINMTQLPMVVFPMLSGKYGLDEASAAMTDATKQYFSGGFDNDNIPGGVKRFPADFSFGVGLPTNSPLDKLYKAAVRQSAIRRSTGYDLVEGRKKTYGTGDYVGLMAKMEQIAGWMFQNSERFNREVTLIAAFNLEMKKNNGNVDGAIKAAIDLVNMTHGTVLTETSPRIFQTGFFKVAFTFKNFAQTQVYLQAKLLRDAVKGETREVKELAAKQLIGTMSMAFLFSGLQGMPFYSASTLLVDLLADMFGDDDDPLKSNEIVRQSVGALAHKGVVNELFMADVASRTGFNSLLWKDDDKRLEEVGPPLFAAEQIFGPAYSAGMGLFRGYKDYKEGHTDRALEAIAPAAIRNTLKAWRFKTEGAKSRSGELIFDDFNRYEIFMQTLGFTPVEVARRSESAGALASRINNITKRKTALLDRYYLARTNNDREGEKEAKEAIKKFNQNEFVRKTRNIINDGELYESFNRRRKNARNSIYGINVAEKSRRVLQDTYMLEEDR